jgi:hypothetical protein
MSPLSKLKGRFVVQEYRQIWLPLVQLLKLLSEGLVSRHRWLLNPPLDVQEFRQSLQSSGFLLRML